MTDVEIRQLEEVPNLAPIIGRWIETEWRRLPIHEYFEAVSQIPRDGQSLPRTLVAIHKGNAVGTVSLLRDDMEIRPDLNPWLGCLFVIKEYRNQGLATQLVQEAERLAKTQGIHFLFLFTVHEVDFFARLGWIKIGEEFYERQTCTLMKRQLLD